MRVLHGACKKYKIAFIKELILQFKLLLTSRNSVINVWEYNPKNYQNQTKFSEISAISLLPVKTFDHMFSINKADQWDESQSPLMHHLLN